MIRARIKRGKLIAPRRPLALAKAIVKYALAHKPYPAKGKHRRFIPSAHKYLLLRHWWEVSSQ